MGTIEFLLHEIKKATSSRIEFDLLCQRLADYCLQELQQINKKTGVQETTIKELADKIKRDVLTMKEKKAVPYIMYGLIGIFIGCNEKRLMKKKNLECYEIPIKIDWWFYGKRNFE